MQSTSRYPRTVRLRYSVVPLWKRKKVCAQAPRDRYTRFRSSARSAWRDQRSAPGDSIHILLTPLQTTMNVARGHVYRGHKKPPSLKKLPPTDDNLQLHVLRAHLQMLLWKAADQRDPPEEARNIANFGWNIEGSAITTAVSTAPVAPQTLLDAVSCSCTAQCKAYSGTRCSCNSAGLSCTDSCKCDGRDICCSPFISKQLDTEDDEGERSDMMNKFTLHFFVLYIYIYIYIYIYSCISKRRANKFKFTYVLFR